MKRAFGEINPNGENQEVSKSEGGTQVEPKDAVAEESAAAGEKKDGREEEQAKKPKLNKDTAPTNGESFLACVPPSIP